MNIAKTVGRRIKVARTELGWNQTELANRIGTSQVNIARYENARVTIDIETLARIAQVMQKDINWFFQPLPTTEEESLPKAESPAARAKRQKAA